jgi:O-antigen/teichoic acid export membrane protein
MMRAVLRQTWAPSIEMNVKDTEAARTPGLLSRGAFRNLIFTGVYQAQALLRLTPFDISTQEGRSKERYRRAALTTFASAGAMGASILITLLSVRLTVRYLGTERYGLWMTITSFLAMLSFADLGLGNGLLNAISEAHGRNDRDAARKSVSSAFFMLFGVAVLILLACVIAYPFVPWPRVFNVSSRLAVREAGPAMLVFASCFVLNLPLGVVQRVQMGYQKGFASSLWQVAGNLMGLGGLVLAIYLKKGLPWLVLAMSGGPVVAAIFNWIAEFGWSSPRLLPKWSFFDHTIARKVLVLGMQFFLLQLAGALAFASDNIVVAQVLGSAAVTQYAVPMRLFAVLGSVVALFFAPLWPAYGEAVARGDIDWTKRTLVRSLWLTLLICGLMATVLVIFGKTIIHYWVGSEIQPSFLLLLGMGVWALLSGLGTTLATFLNGANLIRFEIACALPMALSAVIAKTILARTIGLPGIIWGLVIAYVVTTVLPFSLYIPKVLSSLQLRFANASKTPMVEEQP